ncbi:hypothetical protein ACHWQZ_G004042 [Mnemiopsis leidyi]
MVPLRRLPGNRSAATVTTQPDRSNRWYPTQGTTPSPAVSSPAPMTPFKGEVSVLTRPNYPQPPAPAWNPPPPSQGSFVCFTQQRNRGGVSSETFHFNTPYEYFYQQSTLRQAGFMEQGRVIGNPFAGGPLTHNGTNTKLAINPGQQFMANTNCTPYSNPYFDMNNVRNQISGLQGYGACTGNPFLTPNFFNQPVQSNMFSPNPSPSLGLNRNAQTNTTLKLTHQAKSSDKSSKSRDQGTETILVLGSKKRNRSQKIQTKRLTEHLAAPGAERNNIFEIKRRQMDETSENARWGLTETATESGQRQGFGMGDEQLVLEIKVENSVEMIMDSMIEVAEKEIQTDLCDKISQETLSQEEAKQPTFAQVVSGDLSAGTPIKTTSIEEIFTEESGEPTRPDLQEVEEPKDTAQGPQTPLTPLTPLSPGFEWCEEYEYELVDHNEHDLAENEEPLDIELEFDLDSPQSVTSPGPAQ